MAIESMKVQVSMAWWFPTYLYLLAFFCVLMRQEPDMVKFHRVIKRAMRLKVT